MRYADIERDEIVTSLIEREDKEKFKEIRNRLIKENPKKYYDTIHLVEAFEKRIREI